LLVFVHADDDNFRPAGAASPRWSINDGELPEDAVLREVREETGKVGFEIERYLGAAEYDTNRKIGFWAGE
jgi:ADP-ribose pyrophosphatase YjhB (NUDIX family)